MMNAPPLRKAFPSRQSRSPSMGAFGNPMPLNNGGGYGDVRMMSPTSPTGKTLLEGYGDQILNGFQEETPRYNPMNAAHPQSSALLNINDSIQVHLLVETALGDSKEFELLSQEEVDDLKRECQMLTQRIEQTRQNLAIQSKYRDAAISMAKLYTPGDRKKSVDEGAARRSRRSLLGHKKMDSDQLREAELERLNSEKKCEDLAKELWSYEKRLMEPQKRLLQHTAGILQMTHKGPSKASKSNPADGGAPGSPESMFTYHNSRNSVEPIYEENFFDERSLYRNAETLDWIGGVDKSRGVEEMSDKTKEQIEQQMKTIAQTEQKLEDLNSRLREVIIKANPQHESTYEEPPYAPASEKLDDAASALMASLKYLEHGLTVIDEEHTRKDQQQNGVEAGMEEQIERVNREIRSLLLPYDPTRPLPPQLSGTSLKDQLKYFQASVGAVQNELSRAESKTSKNLVSHQENLEQYQTVLTGLWDIIQSSEEETRQQARMRREMRVANGEPEDKSDMDDDYADSTPFSLQSFSAKVQELTSQLSRLKDHKDVLQRQIKQQRELNSKSDAVKDAEYAEKVEELLRTQDILQRTERDADSMRAQLSELLEQHGAHSEAAASFSNTQAELKSANDQLRVLEEELHDLKEDHGISSAEMKSKIASHEEHISSLKVELQQAAKTKADLDEFHRLMALKEQELEDMSMKVAELQTEVTIARADLDGAYGTRAQRAAEVAANPAIQREIDGLNNRNASLNAEIEALRASGLTAAAEIEGLRASSAKSLAEIESLRAEQKSVNATRSAELESHIETLQRELSETIEEYETMTKASIGWEKEREALERLIDQLRDEREHLEGQLSDEKVKWLGMSSPGPDSQVADGMGLGGAGHTSTTVLKTEFKKMMRDTRAESLRQLRAEQTERRRLEEELRTLKRAAGPGRSGLSQSVAT